MINLTVTREVDAPSADVWAALADFGNIYFFHPGLKGSHLTGDQGQGIGTTRRCDLKDGGYLLERVSEGQEGARYTVDITETSYPLKSAGATLGVEPLGPNRARIFMKTHFTAKFGPIGAVMEVLMLRPVMRKQMRGILDGLARFVTEEKRAGQPGGAALSAAG